MVLFQPALKAGRGTFQRLGYQLCRLLSLSTTATCSTSTSFPVRPPSRHNFAARSWGLGLSTSSAKPNRAPSTCILRHASFVFRRSSSSSPKRQAPLAATNVEVTRDLPPKEDAESKTKSSSFPETNSKSVAYWLLGSAASVFGIVVFGGLTRLTESGYALSVPLRIRSTGHEY